MSEQRAAYICPACEGEAEVCAEMGHEWVPCPHCGEDTRPGYETCPTCGKDQK